MLRAKLIEEAAMVGVGVRWQTFFAVALAAVLCAMGAAQAATYAFRNTAFAYDTPTGAATTVSWHATGGAPACTGYPNGDDDWADVVFPGGFAFIFGGISYSGLRVYSNGIIAFGTDVSGFHRDYTAQALPITAGPGALAGCVNAVPVNLMLPYWIDIVAGTANSTAGASVKHELLGSAPNRRFVISWDNVKLYSQAARYNFQVVLYESSSGANGHFEYRYTSGSSNGANATVGVQLSTTDYTQYSYNQQFIDTTNGTAILWYPANQVQTKSAEYRFDEFSWNGTAGEVKDTSGNSQDAVRVGSAASHATGKLCRGGSFTNNTLNSTRDAVATPLTPGNTGSIGFWFNSNSAWNSADAMLLDATTVANRPFFLSKRSTGALRFAVSDSAGTTVTANTGNLTYAANTWRHIGITWNVRPGNNQTLVQIFVDGVLTAWSRGTTNGTLPALSTIYVGDNRTAGVTPSNGTPNGANGRIDEVYVYALDVSAPQFAADVALTRPTCTSLDHFHIIHAGSVACGGTAQITIEAHDQNHANFLLSGTSITVATSTALGTWSVISAINPLVVTGPGAVSYTFANESSIILGLAHPTAGNVNINTTSGSVTEHSGVASTCVSQDYTTGTTCDADLVVASCVSGFECLENGANFTNLVSTPSGRNPLYTKLAGTAFDIDVVAVNSSGAQVSAYASDADKAVTVELVDGSGATACAARTPIGTSSTLTFGAVDQGRKKVTLTLNPAAKNLRCRITDANQSPSVVGCSSDNFAVRPGAVVLSTNASAAAPLATATPVIKAGAAFTLSAATTTAANDGYGEALVLNTSKLTAQDPTSGSQQNGGAVGGLSPAALTANASPAPSGNATYSEVGYLYLASAAYQDINYTAVDQAPGDCVADSASVTLVSGKYGCVIGNASTVSLGRFIPDHFDTVVTNACGAFSYSGQPFGLTVRAENLAGIVTQNYASLFAKAGTLSDVNGAAGGFSPSSVAASKFSAGIANLTSSPEIAFTYTGKLTAPSTLQVRVVDADMVSSSGGSEGTTGLRSGRLVLSNAHGSDLLNLLMPVQAQYWTGSLWATNTLDSCTNLGAANLLVTSPAPCTTPSGGMLAAGKGQLSFSAPNSKCVVGVCASLGADADHAMASCRTASAGQPVWLQGSWDAGGGYDDNPSARATFGIFEQRSPVIYRRERY